MRYFNSLMAILLAFSLVSCSVDEEEKKVYPALQSIEDTLWYSFDTKAFVYYDIAYEQTTGSMVGYSDVDRKNEVSRANFSYTFTPATVVDGFSIDAIVHISFDDGRYYGGMLIPKGELQINNEDVFIIQLYETNDRWEVIYDMSGNMKSTIMMWKE